MLGQDPTQAMRQEHWNGLIYRLSLQNFCNIGGDGEDSLIGGSGADSLTGGAGRDTIDGGEGADTIDGGDGDDDLVAGGGDSVTGGHGDTVTINFSEIEHVIEPQNLNYIVEGTVGGDLIDGSYAGDPDGDMIDNGDGNPLTPDVGNDDSIVAGAGDDTILSGDGDDTIVIEDSFGNDTIQGGETGETGGDILDASATTTDLTLDLSVGEAADIFDRDAGADTTFGVFTVIRLDGSLNISEVTTGTIFDTGVDMYVGPSTSEGLESYSNLGGQGSTSLTLSNGEVLTEFGQIVTAIVNVNGVDVQGYLVEFYTANGSEYAFVPQRDENSDNLVPGEAMSITGMGGSAVTMMYNDIASPNNPESGTLSDGTSTATFTEIEEVILGSGDDIVIGSQGDDNVNTGTGADTVDGGQGDDSFDLGGADNAVDVVVLENGDGNDTIAGFEAPIDNGDGTYGPQDQLDVTGLTDPATGDPVVTTDVTITPDGSGNTTLTFPDGTSVLLMGTTAPTTDPTDPATESWLNAIGITSPAAAPNFIIEGTDAGELIDATYTGDPEGDMVDAGDNETGTDADAIDAGAGDDTINAGLGDDTIYADEGDDSVEGGAGNDSILGYEGSDTVDGGDGDDYINTRTSPGTGIPDIGLTYPDDPNTPENESTLYSYPSDTDANNDRDSVIGGAGNDTILTGDDADTIDGGIGDDVIDAGFDADLVSGGAGTDSIQGGEGADTVDGGDDDDIIYGGLSPLDPNYAASSLYDLTDDIDPSTTNNADYLIGGAGNDRIYGQDDSDTLEGGTGNDTLDGGIDNDVLTGGAGDDVLTGGQGNDQFTFDNDGNDTITDFGVGITGNPNDGVDQTDNDFLDLSSYYDDLGELRADFADDGILNQSNSITNGGTVDYSNNTAMTGTLTLTGATTGDLTYDTTNVTCFTSGTIIRTVRGLVAVDELKQGDLVWTKDNGYKPIQWIGSRSFRAHVLRDNPNLVPVRIKHGALGSGLPTQDMWVSQQHRILINSKIVKRVSGETEVLAAARHLVRIDGIDINPSFAPVQYWHFMFDQHEIVEANGCLTESMFTGPEAMKTISQAARQELLEIFPEIFEANFEPVPVRTLLSGRMARKLADRHRANNKALFTTH